jgi:protein SCO1/2
MRGLMLAVLLCCLLGCSKQQERTEAFIGTDIGGSVLGDNLGLTDQDGTLRYLSDFKGKVVAVFFGYTHCPDVCPTTMADLARARRLLGDAGKQMQVLFVTLDPARDSAEVLKRYVPSFDDSFIGLRGDEAATKKVAQDFKVFFAKQDSGSKAGYSIDHSGGIYVFDKQGRPRIYLNVGQKPQDIAHDVGLLVNE